MAVVTESFCIREYTERMRSIDLGRCWPFDDGTETRAFLPPISVRRFKWWGDELDSSRSAAIVEEEDDTNKDAIPPRRWTALEPSGGLRTGEEGRRIGNKGKQRAPKKRSIVELFAAAPLVEGKVDEEEGNSAEGERWEEEGEEEEEEVEEIDLVMRKKNAMKEDVIKKKKRRKRKKNKGIKDGVKVEICAWQKEKICKPRICKMSRKTAKSFVEIQKQPAKGKAVRKKHKVLQTSILLSRNQDVAKKLPVRSILKKKKRVTSDRKSSKSVSAKAANLIKFYCKSNKHVTFSVKDDTAGNNRACSSMNFPQLQNLCKIFSDVLAASSVMNHSSKGPDLPDANGRRQELNESEKGTHSKIVARTEASSTEKNRSGDSIVNICQPTVVNSSNSSCSGTEKASFAVMVDLNHAIHADDIDCGIPATSTLPSSCIYSGDPNSKVKTHGKNPNSTSDINLEAGLIRLSEPSFLPYPNGKFVASSDVTSSKELQKIPSSHSSASCLVVYDKTDERQCQPHVDADGNCCRQVEEHQLCGHHSPKGLMSNTCTSVRSKKLGESLFTPTLAPTSRSKCPGEDFIGLPLNSRGELIQIHSGTKFSEAYDKQNMEWGSIHGISAKRHVESNGRMNRLEILQKKVAAAASHQKNQSNWNQKQCYASRERVAHWLNFAEMESSERLENQKYQPMKGKDTFLHCNSNPRNHSFHEYRYSDATHDFCERVDLQGKCNIGCHNQAAVQPTMRLMGKNVVVSGINRDYNGFNDGRTWNRNENFAEQTQFPLSEKQFPQQLMQRECVWHPTIGRSKGNLLELLDSSPNFYHMKAFDPALNYMNVTQQPQWPSRSTDSSILNHNFKLDMNNHGLPPQNFMNKPTQFLGNYMSGEGSFNGHRYPAVMPSHAQNFHQQMLLSSSLGKNNQRVSTTHSQFKYKDFGKFSQPPLLQPAAKLPQWLLHAKHQKRTQLSDPHYSDPNTIKQPCNFSGNSSNFHLSPCHVPMSPFSSSGNNDPRKACRPFISSACAPSVNPLAPSTKSSGDVNKRNNSMKMKEGIYSKFTSFKTPADAQKNMKRSAEFEDGRINSAKRHLKGQLDSHVPEEPEGTEQVNDQPQHPDKAISSEFKNAANENGLCRTVNNSSSLKFDKELRPGPTKLIAGAKHILKPCQRMDERSCRPIHSTIMVPSSEAPGKLFGPEKKISNIYNF